MAFLDDLEKKLTQTGQNVKNKAKELADVTNLKGQIREEEKRLQKYYASLGEAYYERKPDQIPPELEGLIKTISESRDKIKNLEKDIKIITEAPVCAVCGKPLKPGSAFCTGCGARVADQLEEIKPAEEVRAELPTQEGTTELPLQEEKAEIPYQEEPPKKICSGCQAELPPYAVFCTNCGKKQEEE